ncbi:hypothetical protein SAMN02799625_04653 [Methylobacterium sp. UNC300MFChir4.1]|uniref:hypothetical protein n=1 Tax=Methylobacterium sp. UNC300MFChir4.1 TaxID=1502747 RepID=UPI0008B19577|nr:hypothetical protein [Methylobacterium sp. UNC300MFChir4.1]SEP09496.1 hypothetical protein SAMN02799625_04653 [Methylobacterium sp. UNC300MFChir4.1]
MARVSIYVSDELKARMTEAGDALNWSDIARPAFETALATFNHRKGQNMQTAIERLRASKAQHFEERDAGAIQRGRDWAADKATFAELKELDKIDLNLFDHGVNDLWRAVKDALDPDGQMSHNEAAEVWFGDHQEDGDAGLEAWVAGAQGFFTEVEDQL